MPGKPRFRVDMPLKLRQYRSEAPASRAGKVLPA
jgi:hypothetical protein